MSLINKAKTFAKKKHEGQMRKFENKPYYIHPKRVAHILQQFKVSTKIEELVCAAYLHDTLEDTDTTFKELVENFGTFIAKLVFDLTSDDEGVRTLGKKDYLLNKMINMSNYALAIKLADRIDNVNRIHWTNENFKNKYIAETKFIVDNLKEKRALTGTHKRMIREIEKHLSEHEAVDDIDYLAFDSYFKRGQFDEAVI